MSEMFTVKAGARRVVLSERDMFNDDMARKVQQMLSTVGRTVSAEVIYQDDAYKVSFTDV